MKGREGVGQQCRSILELLFVKVKSLSLELEEPVSAVSVLQIVIN